jgi:hypothetical protein
MECCTYQELRKLIKTGDIIGFSGKAIVPRIIQRWIKGENGHVGMALWMENLEGEGDRLFIIESTTMNYGKPDIDGSYRRGVQMMTLSQRIDGFPGKCRWYQLKIPIDKEKELEMRKWLLGVHSSKVPYDYAQAIASGLDPEKWPWFWKVFVAPLLRILITRNDLKALFCSELCTKALQLAGILDPLINPSEQHP